MPFLQDGHTTIALNVAMILLIRVENQIITLHEELIMQMQRDSRWEFLAFVIGIGVGVVLTLLALVGH